MAVEPDPGGAEAALAGLPVQLHDQHPDPRHEQHAAHREEPRQQTRSPIHDRNDARIDNLFA
jgi:hypothetical protein